MTTCTLQKSSILKVPVTGIGSAILGLALTLCGSVTSQLHTMMVMPRGLCVVAEMQQVISWTLDSWQLQSEIYAELVKL